MAAGIMSIESFKRAWPSGRAVAFQATYTGSIPVARSNDWMVRMSSLGAGEQYIELKLVMRSRTTGGEDSEVIRVWGGDSAGDVAKRVAGGYGADVVSLQRMDGTE